jgi:hypothetical protein
MSRKITPITDMIQISAPMRAMIEDIKISILGGTGDKLDDKQALYLAIYSYLLSVDPEFTDNPIDAAIYMASYPADEIEAMILLMEQKRHDTNSNKGHD